MFKKLIESKWLLWGVELALLATLAYAIMWAVPAKAGTQKSIYEEMMEEQKEVLKKYKEEEGEFLINLGNKAFLRFFSETVLRVPLKPVPDELLDESNKECAKDVSQYSFPVGFREDGKVACFNVESFLAATPLVIQMCVNGGGKPIAYIHPLILVCKTNNKTMAEEEGKKKDKV